MVNTKRSVLGLIITMVGLALVASQTAKAERLPTRIYTTADGLVSNRISRIVRDSRGYLWFCTEDGLSRFDGYTFTNYTTQQGLPDNFVDDLVEARDGTYWIATAKGLCRLNPMGVPLPRGQSTNQDKVIPFFSVYRPHSEDSAAKIKALYEDQSGTLWCGTRQGVYRVEQEGAGVEFRYVDFGIARDERGEQYVRGITEDRRGALWVSSRSGLYRRLPDGRCEGFTMRNGLPSTDLMRVIANSAGEIWVPAMGLALRIAAELDANQSIVAERYGVKDGLPCADIDVLAQTADGRFWMGGDCGLSELLRPPVEHGDRIRVQLDAKTLANASVWAVCEDLSGNLWIGTSNGAVRIARLGFTTYTALDGLAAAYITSISQSQSGEVYLDMASSGQHLIAVFDGKRFVALKPNLPARLSKYEWGIGHSTFQDREGEWWLPTSNGLIRFPSSDRVEQLARARPKAVYDVADGLPSSNVFHIYEDRNGDLWLSISGNVQARVVRWERRTGQFRAYSEMDGLPPSHFYPNTFCEDRAGNLWLGFEGGGVARLAGGRFKYFNVDAGVPEGDIQNLYIDGSGRLWLVSSRSGLGAPTTERRVN